MDWIRFWISSFQCRHLYAKASYYKMVGFLMKLDLLYRVIEASCELIKEYQNGGILDEKGSTKYEPTCFGLNRFKKVLAMSSSLLYMSTLYKEVSSNLHNLCCSE